MKLDHLGWWLTSPGTAWGRSQAFSLKEGSSYTQLQLQHNAEVLTLQWHSSSEKPHTGKCSILGSRSPWYLRVGSGYRRVRLVQAWDSDEETAMHRGLQNHRKTNGTWTSGIGANMMPQSLGKASCPAEEAWDQSRQSREDQKATQKLSYIDSQSLARGSSFSHINPAHVHRHHLKKEQEKGRNSGRWAFTPEGLN